MWTITSADNLIFTDIPFLILPHWIDEISDSVEFISYILFLIFSYFVLLAYFFLTLTEAVKIERFLISGFLRNWLSSYIIFKYLYLHFMLM